LCIQVSIHDPFQPSEGFYATCFRGELRQRGLETKTAFLTIYKPASGAESDDPLLFAKYAPEWMTEFSTTTRVSKALDDALQKRGRFPQAGIRWRLFEKLIGSFIQAPPIRSKVPPIFHYLQALLHYHSGEFDEAIVEAKRYLDSLRVHDHEEKHIIPLIQACERCKTSRTD
jgi:hypothetical protein